MAVFVNIWIVHCCWFITIMVTFTNCSLIFLAVLCGSSALIYLGDGQVARHQVKSPISVWNAIMEGVTDASQVQQAQNTLHSLEIC